MKSSEERTLPLAPSSSAEASRSNSCPLVVRGSQPNPTMARRSPGSALVSERLLPLPSVSDAIVLFLSVQLKDPGCRVDQINYCAAHCMLADGLEGPAAALAGDLGHD